MYHHTHYVFSNLSLPLVFYFSHFLTDYPPTIPRLVFHFSVNFFATICYYNYIPCNTSFLPYNSSLPLIFMLYFSFSIFYLITHHVIQNLLLLQVSHLLLSFSNYLLYNIKYLSKLRSSNGFLSFAFLTNCPPHNTSYLLKLLLSVNFILFTVDLFNIQHRVSCVTSLFRWFPVLCSFCLVLLHLQSLPSSTELICTNNTACHT